MQQPDIPELDQYHSLTLLALDDCSVAQVSDNLCGTDSPSPLSALVAAAMGAFANRLVIEEGYIDFVYRDEYAAYYAGTFSDPGSSCRRLLFFHCPDATESDTVLGVLDSKTATLVASIVLRPTGRNRVGRTLIQEPAKGAEVFMTCSSRFSVHLMGRQYWINGFPFVQQDGHVMRCAQACLLMCMLFLQGSQAQALALPHEISELATREFVQLGRPFPSTGLLAAEINNFLWKVGYGPLRYSNPPLDDQEFEPCLFIPYLLSGIPALLMTDDHVVTATGFTIRPRETEGFRIINFEDLVDTIQVHDDGVSPYCILPEPNCPVSPNQAASSVQDLGSISGCIIPCPRKMYLRAKAVQELAVEILESDLTLAWLLARATEHVPAAKTVSSILADAKPTDTLVLRAGLVKSQRIKSQCLRQKEFLDPAIVELYTSTPMPRMVWVVEVALMSTITSGGKEIVGEFLFDSTSSRDQAEIFTHLPGLLINGRDREALDVAGPDFAPSWILDA